jgi:peptide/nickel transport system permease protein
MTAQPTIAKIGAPEQEEIRTKSLLQKALYRVWHDRLTMGALIIIGILTLLSILAPVITTQILQVDYIKPDLRNNYAPIGTPGHILGTDDLGRDHLARLLYGGQVSLGIAFFAAVLALMIGITIGVITGYYGGVIDDFVIWLITTLDSIPSLFLLLIISAFLSPGPLSLILILAFLGWIGATRIVRGETFSLRERDFTLAARAMGASDWRIMFVHIVPNVASLLIISLTSAIGGLILTESALSFLGFGVKAPTPSWGNMLSGGIDLLRRAPHLIFVPGFLISLTVFCLYLIGDGLRDAFDPRTAD